MPTEEIHQVAASGVMAFIKQSSYALHMLEIKTDLKVLVYLNNFIVNFRDITVVKLVKLFLQGSGGLSSLPIVFQCNKNLGFAYLFAKWSTFRFCEEFPYAC